MLTSESHTLLLSVEILHVRTDDGEQTYRALLTDGNLPAHVKDEPTLKKAILAALVWLLRKL